MRFVSRSANVEFAFFALPCSASGTSDRQWALWVAFFHYAIVPLQNTRRLFTFAQFGEATFLELITRSYEALTRVCALRGAANIDVG
jgi:hypothetical protein